MIYDCDSRALLFGLLVRCPFEGPDESCPLLSKRSSNPHKMREMAMQMGDDDMNRILSHHDMCAALRDKEVHVPDHNH